MECMPIFFSVILLPNHYTRWHHCFSFTSASSVLDSLSSCLEKSLEKTPVHGESVIDTRCLTISACTTTNRCFVCFFPHLQGIESVVNRLSKTVNSWPTDDTRLYMLWCGKKFDSFHEHQLSLTYFGKIKFVVPGKLFCFDFRKPVLLVAR